VYEYNKPIYNDSDEDDVDGDWDDYDADADFDSDEGWESDATKLAIRNYVENKHGEGTEPSVKQVRSLKAVRDAGLNTSEVGDILDQLGFEVWGDEATCLTDKLVLVP